MQAALSVAFVCADQNICFADTYLHYTRWMVKEEEAWQDKLGHLLQLTVERLDRNCVRVQISTCEQWVQIARCCDTHPR